MPGLRAEVARLAPLENEIARLAAENAQLNWKEFTNCTNISEIARKKLEEEKAPHNENHIEARITGDLVKKLKLKNELEKPKKKIFGNDERRVDDANWGCEV